MATKPKSTKSAKTRPRGISGKKALQPVTKKAKATVPATAKPRPKLQPVVAGANYERKHLTGREVDHLLAAVKGGGRNEARDRCLVLLMFRHGLRVSEACGLRLDQVDTESRVLHVARLKGGLSTTHPLRGDELRVIKAWLTRRSRMRVKPTVKRFFVSEQRTALHRSTVNLALKKYGELAALPLQVHPHMLRHACGYALADQGADTRLIQDYLGHRNIAHTVRYTATNPARFERLWR
jgi:type 1 fimbriae regulatory protein FimB